MKTRSVGGRATPGAPDGVGGDGNSAGRHSRNQVSSSSSVQRKSLTVGVPTCCTTFPYLFPMDNSGNNSVKTDSAVTTRSGRRSHPAAYAQSTLSTRMVHIPMVKQSQGWDCGLACVSMVLSVLDKYEDIDNLHKVVGTESVWTIDLVQLLLEKGVSCVFLTITTGVNHEYSGVDFYRNNLQEDELRVSALFEAMLRQGQSLFKASITWQHLGQQIIGGNCIVIALIDSRYRTCSCARWEDIDALTLRLEHYLGHYVLLCGYDPHRRVFRYKDPCRNACADYCEIRGEDLDTARKQFGTDEDLIIIKL